MSEENKEETQELTAAELSELLQVRRDKLKYFQEEGRDPFVQTRFDRSAWSMRLRMTLGLLTGRP